MIAGFSTVVIGFFGAWSRRDSSLLPLNAPQSRPAHDPRKHARQRMLTASCANCGHQADVNVDLLPETLTVPEAGRRLRCSQCGAKTISTRPPWHTGRNAWGREKS
jgi:hypothetical protein